MDEANFENILTAELYTVNLNGKKLFKSADMYAGENFSHGNYLMISTIQNHFLYPSQSFPDKTVIYDKEVMKLRW
jgi:hypothetical protein